MDPISVSEVNQAIKTVLENQESLSNITVEGEISNFKQASSGHCYFSLKDKRSELRCIMWRSTLARLRFDPENGQHVQASGKIEVYVQRGSYSLIVSNMIPAGIGTLYQIFMMRLNALKEHGWLNPEIKKELPEKIKTVGVVTSETGAVIHDIITTIERRDPGLTVLLAPAAVQGEGAGEEIAAQIDRLNKEGNVDVIIVGRGGGSMEDLWEFNDMGVVQAIHNSDVPVISAVGHETDFTLCDYVADLRAPTPTAAAEFVSFGTMEILNILDTAFLNLNRLIEDKINSKSTILERLSNTLRLLSPENKLNVSQFKIDELDQRLNNQITRILDRYTNTINQLKIKLELLNPKSVMTRGYVMVTNEEDKLISLVSETTIGENLFIHFSDGKVKTTVEEQYGERKG